MIKGIILNVTAGKALYTVFVLFVFGSCNPVSVSSSLSQFFTLPGW